MGATINTGNFESIRVDYGFEGEVPEGVKPDDAMRKVEQWVEGLLERKIKEVRSEIEGVHGS